MSCCFRIALVTFAVLGAAGCDNGRKPVYPVRGTLTDADGKPMRGAIVTFCPAASVLDNDGKPAGFCDDEGNFSLTTYANDDGAPAGDYVVTLEWRVATDTPTRPRKPPPDRLNGRFSNPAGSPLRATIVKGKNVVELKLPLREKEGAKR
jgi:hypothetical protein